MFVLKFLKMRFLILRRVNTVELGPRLHRLTARYGPEIIRKQKKILAVLLVLYLYHLIHNYEGDQSLRNAPLSGWGREKPLSVGHYLDPRQDTAIVVPRDFCRSKAFVLIVVCSFVHHFERRRAIRITWGNTTHFNYPDFVKLHGHLKGKYLDILPERRKRYAEYLSAQGDSMTASIRVVFVLGRRKLSSLWENEAVAREAEEHNDIIQENFMDTYNNLTIKSILALKHISRDCMNSTAFVFKCDDDTFVNVPNLLHFLLGGTIPLYNDTLAYHYRSTCQVMSRRKRLTARSGVLLGHQYCNVSPIMWKRNKWYVPSYMYRGEWFPRYLCGSGYVMSIDVVPLLYRASLGTRIMHLEDVFITGLCAEKAGIKRFNQPLFQSGYSENMCSFKGSFTQHRAKDYLMYETWYFVTNYSIRCPPPYVGFEKNLRSHQVC